MTVKVNEKVKSYLQKSGAAKIVVRMIPNRTPFGCGGKSRKYYTPDIQLMTDNKILPEGYEEFQDQGVSVWVSSHALASAEGDKLDISLANALFEKQLVLEGIPEIVYEGEARWFG